MFGEVSFNVLQHVAMFAVFKAAKIKVDQFVHILKDILRYGHTATTS